MAPQEIYYSRSKPLFLLAVCLGATLCVYFGLDLTPTALDGEPLTLFAPWMVWGSLGVVILAAGIVTLCCVLDRRVQIRIAEEGFSDRRTRFGTIGWGDIRSVDLFSPTKLPTSPKFIRLTMRDTERYLARLPAWSRMGAGASSSLYFSVSFLELTPEEIKLAVERRLVGSEIQAKS